MFMNTFTKKMIERQVGSNYSSTSVENQYKMHAIFMSKLTRYYF